MALSEAQLNELAEIRREAFAKRGSPARREPVPDIRSMMGEIASEKYAQAIAKQLSGADNAAISDAFATAWKWLQSGNSARNARLMITSSGVVTTAMVSAMSDDQLRALADGAASGGAFRMSVIETVERMTKAARAGVSAAVGSDARRTALTGGRLSYIAKAARVSASAEGSEALALLRISWSQAQLDSGSSARAGAIASGMELSVLNLLTDQDFVDVAGTATSLTEFEDGLLARAGQVAAQSAAVAGGI